MFRGQGRALNSATHYTVTVSASFTDAMSIESKIVGHLKEDDFDPNFYTSEPIAIPYFDNIKLQIGFIEAKHVPYMELADKALKIFLTMDAKNRKADSELVQHYYEETLKYGYTAPLNVKISQDIWTYVTPKEIIVHWDQHGDIYLCVSCDCVWEVEHGLQLVFKDGRILTRASGHDGHLTD